MATEVILPELGENIESAVVVAVLVGPGDAVSVDQPLLELESEKATAELPSPVEGVVEELRVKVGDEVRVGQALLTIRERGAEAAPPAPAPAPEPAAEPRVDVVEEKQPGPAAGPGPGAPPRADRTSAGAGGGAGTRSLAQPTGGPPLERRTGLPFGGPESEIPAGPSVRRLARELGIDLAGVAGSGPRGRVTTDDVTAHARRLISERGPAPGAERRPAPAPGPRREPQPEATAARPPLPDLSEWGPVEREPMSGVRRKTAESIARSWALAAQVTQHDEADVTELERARRRLQPRVERAGGDGAARPKLTVTAIAVKVAAAALRAFPQFNAALDLDALEIVYRRYVNIGVAVDAGHGLLVPVIRDADRKGLIAIATELANLSARARAKKLKIEEMRGAGFTITNLGGIGTTTFTPILNWPESAILGLGRAETRARWTGDAFEPRVVLPLSLTYDHRLIDGADAARFERWIAEALESPLVLALEA